MKLNKFFFHLIQNQKPPEINSDGFLLCHIFLRSVPIQLYNSLFASTISGYRTLYTMISSIGRYKNPL